MAAAPTLLDIPDFHRCRTYLHYNDASMYASAGEEGRANFTKTPVVCFACAVSMSLDYCAPQDSTGRGAMTN
jgi:hypothetical protein